MKVIDSNSPTIILASSSRYRQTLLKRIIPRFDAINPDIDETSLVDESAQDLAQRLAQAKADKIAQQYPAAIVIAADQVALCDGKILGKPGNHDNALQQLSFCSGKSVQFLTQTCLVHQDSNLNLTHLSQVELCFLTLSPDTIEQYLKQDQPYDCAGSFKVESFGIQLFEWIKSDDPTSLVGLPLIAVNRLLKQALQWVKQERL